MAETMVGRMAAKSASWMVGKKVHWTELLLAAALVELSVGPMAAQFAVRTVACSADRWDRLTAVLLAVPWVYPMDGSRAGRSVGRMAGKLELRKVATKVHTMGLS